MIDATSDADPTDDTDAAPDEPPQPFENRAARRSKGKTTTNHTAGTGGPVLGRSGTVQRPRQYGNRRSG